MFRLLRFLVADRRRAKLERLITLAGRMDEVLMTATLMPETRQQLQGKREELEGEIRELMGA
jgi:hypothetical protein